MSLTKKNLLVKVTVHKFSFKVRDAQSVMEVSAKHDVDPTLLDFKKNTMVKDDVRDITKIMNKFRPLVLYYTMPWLDGGWRLLSVDLYEKLEDKLRELNSELSEAREALRYNWDKYVENARKKLNGKFNESDYPSADYVASKFKVDVHYGNVPTSGDLRVDMAQDAVNSIRSQMEAYYEDNMKRAMKEVWDRTITVITHMKDKLTDYSESVINDERKTPLYDSMLNNIKDLIQLLKAMNLTNDPKLETIRQEIEANFADLTIDLLKESEITREETIEKMEKILDIEDII